MNPFSKLEPVDIIAIVCIVGGFILMACHIDTVVGGVVSLIAGYYFGHQRKKEEEEFVYEKIKEKE